MKARNFTNQFLLLFATAFLSACGSSNGDSGVNSEVSERADIKIISGGPPTSPVYLDFALKHEISSDKFYNYYQVSVQKGEKLVVYAVLDQLLDDTSYYRCVNSNSNTFDNNYYPGIRIEGGSYSCDEKLTYEFEAAGIFTIQVGYEAHHSGYFYAAVIPSDSGSSQSSPSELLVEGRPDTPKNINFTSANDILSEAFYNYYQYTARRGDELYIGVVLDQVVDDVSNYRCVNSNSNTFDNNYYPGIRIDGGDYSCQDSLVYSFEKDGNYLIKLGYENYHTGYFNADVVLSTESFFIDIQGAERGILYTSSDLAIQEDNTLVNIESGILVKNAVELEGLSTQANAGDIINIRQVSSNDLGRQLSTQVSIGGRQEAYIITTKFL